MESYYHVLGLSPEASPAEVKRAFREKAKRLHPDIAGAAAAAGMRRLLAAYQTLSDRERRFEYDRAYRRFTEKAGFDYRRFLRERRDDPESQAKLVFFELLHLEDEAAIAAWDAQGGPAFRLEARLDREDWMDCAFLLAEALDKQGRGGEAFALYAALVREERRKPYFRHFMEEVEDAVRELTRLRLRQAVGAARYLECLETLLTLGFPKKDEERWAAELRRGG
ncbi:MAG: molecular chaperone DnaJ [Treponematales bacterium]